MRNLFARNILIGCGAGLAAALLFASLVSGTALAFPLFLLSPLPIAIAGLGFGTFAGAAGALTAALLIALAIGNVAAGFYLVLFAAPVAWTAHLAGLSRPSETDADARDWFPLGAVFFRTAIVVGVAVVLTGALLGYDPTTLARQTLDAVRGIVAEQKDTGAAQSPVDLQNVVAGVVSWMPFVAPGMVLLILTVDFWLAARIVRMSGLLVRPWVPLWTVALPRPAVTLFVAAIAASLILPHPLGLVAAPIAGALGFAFAMTGYGLLHSVLTERGVRPFILFIVYILSAVFQVPIAIMALAGVGDTLFQLRGRRIRRWTGGA